MPEAFYLPFRRGRRFCVRHAATGTSAYRGALLFVHPFAEEMNKSRRMVALTARALAASGWTVLQVDLFGCGDSDGEFGEADWRQWLSDVAEAAAWLGDSTGCTPALWGLRTGCLLACQTALAMPVAPHLLLWQPALSGRQSLHQFLRLKIASQVFAQPSSDRIDTQQLRAQLAAGEAIEVAGYTLSPGLASGLAAAELAPPAAPARVGWLEVAADASAEPSPAALARIRAWEGSGHRIGARVVAGAAFWQTQEIAECPELIMATLAAVADWPA